MGVRQTLEKLVSINSICGNEHEIAIFLEEFLQNNGFETERQPLLHDNTRYNIYGVKGDSGPSLMLYGHMDTVEIAKDWVSDPFKVISNGDKLIGLGVNDMKGGLAAIMVAIKNFTPVNFKLKVVFAVDEELYSGGAFALETSGILQEVDFCIVPEIGDSGKKRKVNIPNLLILGRRGRISVETTILGKAAHGAIPEEGKNSINAACKVIPQIIDCLSSKLEQDVARKWKGDVFCSRIFGASDFLSIPEKTTFVLSRHFLPSKTIEMCLVEIKECLVNLELEEGFKIADVRLMPRPTPYLEAFITSEDNRYVKGLKGLLDRLYGFYDVAYGFSVADENLIGQYVPTVVLGPVGDLSHQAGEWVSENSLIELVKIFKQVLIEFPTWIRE